MPERRDDDRFNEWRFRERIAAGTVLTAMDAATGERIAVSGSDGLMAAWSASGHLGAGGDLWR